MTEARPTNQPRSAKQGVLRVLVLLSAPLVFFGMAELLLALIGFGGWPPLFVASSDMPGHLEANSRVMQRYFPGRETRLGIDPILFKKEKPAGTLRIVVQGGSTAAGFPYGRWAGLAGMLGDRLEAAHPDSEIEVISTAMAAVNSYTLLDFVDEIIETEPDLVLIYAGHNEYLGIFGAGSAITAGRSRAATALHLRLSRFRVYQLMATSLSAVKNWSAPAGAGGTQARDTLLAQAAKGAEIPNDSETYAEGLLQFETNLSRILEKYERAEIPVYIGTLTSNERDQAPFAGGVLDEANAEPFAALMREAEDSYRSGELERARDAVGRAVVLAPRAANGWFLSGRIEQAARAPEAARAAYRKAKDFDRLRFRAPEAFNQLIRRLAAQYGATVVEVHDNLASRAPMGVVGRELMLEHLHPNARGYFLLADAYFKVLEEEQWIGGPSVVRSLDAAYKDMPITALDRVMATQVLREVRNDFPFRPDRVEVEFPEPKGKIESIAEGLYEDPDSWLAAMESLLQHYLANGQTDDAAVVARVTAQAIPWEWAPNLAAARVLLEAGRPRLAVKYFEKSLAARPDDPATLLLVSRTHFALGQKQRGREAIERLGALDPDHPAATNFEAWQSRTASPGREAQDPTPTEN